MLIGEDKCGGGSADLSVRFEPFLHSIVLTGDPMRTSEHVWAVRTCVPAERCCYVVTGLIVVRACIGIREELSEAVGPTCLRMIRLSSVD